MYVYVPYACLIPRDAEKKGSNPLQLRLQMVRSLGLLQEQVLSTVELSIQPIKDLPTPQKSVVPVLEEGCAQGGKMAAFLPESVPHLAFSSRGLAGNLSGSLASHPNVWLPAHMTFFLCECLSLGKFPLFINTPVILD